MIPDVHLQRSLYPIKSGSSLRIYQALGPLVYPPGGFCHFSQCPNIENEANICIKAKSWLCLAKLSFIPPLMNA